MFFQQSPRGAIEGFVMSGDPQAVYLRQPFLATSAFHVPLLALLAGVLLAALVMIPAAAIVRGVRTPARLDVPRRAIRILVWVTSAVELLFLVAFFKVFTDPGVIYGVPRGVRWVFWLPIAAIPAVLAAAVLVTRAWFHAPSRSARMVLLAIAALGQAGLLVWLSYWNVLFYVFNLVRQG